MAPGFPELNQTVACRSPPSVAEAPAGGRRNRAPSDPDPAAHHRITCFLNRISSSPLTTAKPSSLWHVGREEPRCTAGPQNYRLNQPKSSGKKQQLRLPLALFPVLGRAPSCRGCRNRQPPLLYKSPPSTLPARQSEHRRSRDGMGRTKDHSGSAAATSMPPPRHTIPPRSSSDIRGNNCIGRGSGGLLFGGVVEVTGVQR
jgi:hypothetical protein